MSQNKVPSSFATFLWRQWDAEVQPKLLSGNITKIILEYNREKRGTCEIIKETVVLYLFDIYELYEDLIKRYQAIKRPSGVKTYAQVCSSQLQDEKCPEIHLHFPCYHRIFDSFPLPYHGKIYLLNGEKGHFTYSSQTNVKDFIFDVTVTSNWDETLEMYQKQTIDTFNQLWLPHLHKNKNILSYTYMMYVIAPDIIESIYKGHESSLLPDERKGVISTSSSISFDLIQHEHEPFSLYHLLTHGLFCRKEDDKWAKFLTQGLYDPRLLLIIGKFLYPLVSRNLAGEFCCKYISSVLSSRSAIDHNDFEVPIPPYFPNLEWADSTSISIHQIWGT